MYNINRYEMYSIHLKDKFLVGVKFPIYKIIKCKIHKKTLPEKTNIYTYKNEIDTKIKGAFKIL